ncbi:MAG: hypothetical protein ACYTDU_17575, partial [Planctomycetota bacterium]
MVELASSASVGRAAGSFRRASASAAALVRQALSQHGRGALGLAVRERADGGAPHLPAGIRGQACHVVRRQTPADADEQRARRGADLVGQGVDEHLRRLAARVRHEQLDGRGQELVGLALGGDRLDDRLDLRLLERATAAGQVGDVAYGVQAAVRVDHVVERPGDHGAQAIRALVGVGVLGEPLPVLREEELPGRLLVDVPPGLPRVPTHQLVDVRTDRVADLRHALTDVIHHHAVEVADAHHDQRRRLLRGRLVRLARLEEPVPAQEVGQALHVPGRDRVGAPVQERRLL